MVIESPRFVVRSVVLIALAGAFLAAAALAVGCELAVNPDVSLAEVPVQPCLPCLDASETVITEPDGNVLIVPIDTLDAGDADGGDGSIDGGDADSDAADQ